jgi:hypothetical protein
MLQNLNGSWRLIFTTGTVSTQKKLGRRINFFPVKAVQTFNTDTMSISNGIYAGNFAILKFFGEFEFNLKSKKLVSNDCNGLMSSRSSIYVLLASLPSNDLHSSKTFPKLFFNSLYSDMSSPFVFHMVHVVF